MPPALWHLMGGFKWRQTEVSSHSKIRRYLLGAFISPVYILFLELQQQAEEVTQFTQLLIWLEHPIPLDKILLRFLKAQM